MPGRYSEVKVVLLEKKSRKAISGFPSCFKLMIMENEILNTLELLIHSKQWDELTAQEKDLVIEELGSEEQFLAMKSLDASLKTSINTSHLPNENILPLLKQRMRMKHKTELAF